MSRERIAVVLIVKDDLAILKHWIAWYRDLGFDGIIIFDDGSSDGCSEFLDDLHGQYGVIVESTVGSKTDWYYERQQRCYRYAIEKYKRDFDWIAFFDVDEFLFIEGDLKIADFLATYSGSDAVAVNWCNYGSSGHVVAPSQPPVVSYTWHAAPTHPINRHVKTILRPLKLGSSWFNVHCFDIDPDRYHLTNGKPVQWSSNLGIINDNPDWAKARLMHYQCRSLEDFVARAKKRPELNASVDMWSASDFHDVEEKRPAQRLLATESQAQTVLDLDRLAEKSVVARALRRLPDHGTDSLSLDQIGLLTGTDKSSKHHGYLNFYDSLFGGLRDRPIKLLEIGVDRGASLHMWAHYFTKAHCVGIDISPSALNHVGSRIDIAIGDQSDLAFLEKVRKTYGPFDIIIDDGSHIWDHQIVSFEALFESVRPDGFYVIEDLQTSFEYHDSFAHFRSGREISTVDHLLRIARLTVARHMPVGDNRFLSVHFKEIDSMQFHYGSAVIRKSRTA